MSKRFICTLVFTISLGQGRAALAASDALAPLPPRAVKLEGYLGARLDQCITNRLLAHDAESLVRNFHTRTQDIGGYHGEFIGKWLSASALACRYKASQELETKMRKAADDLAGAASEDGYISTYQKASYFQVWDVWIQKYVLLGLIAQYDATGDARYLKAAQVSADYVLARNGPGKLSIEEYGPEAHKGGVNFSILEPMALLYQRTRESRYRDFASYIVDSWSRPGKRTPRGVRLLENAEEGVPLVESEILHCYVHMSCLEGLCELYRSTGQERYLSAAISAARQIIREERTVIGSMGDHELWCSGSKTQTEMLEKPNETCATATWIKLCNQLLRATGDPAWADEMELALYNALLGAMMPNGEWWCYESPLAGERLPSRVQGLNISCCVSSGPRALLLTPMWAAMQSAEGAPVINLYCEGATSFKLPGGQQGLIVQQTDYPKSGKVRLIMRLQSAETFGLKLRIPRWSKQTRLQVNGEQIACQPGSYATIQHLWQPGDQIELDLDFRGRVIQAPGGAPHHAIMRGPVVLALDSRLVKEEPRTLWLMGEFMDQWLGPKQKDKQYILPSHNLPKSGEEAFISLTAAPTNQPGVLMAFETPFVHRRAAFGYTSRVNLTLCDYASAGNLWSSNNLYRVWIPQPLFLGAAFPKETWKILGASNRRQTVPAPFQALSGTVTGP